MALVAARWDADTGQKQLQYHELILLSPLPYLPKPSRSLIAAASIYASSSPASTARLSSSSVGTNSATVPISTVALPAELNSASTVAQMECQFASVSVSGWCCLLLCMVLFIWMPPG